MRIKWDIFFENSSTIEAIVLFATRNYTFKQFIKECWPKECKEAIKYLKCRGYQKAVKNAQRALIKRGYAGYQEEYRGYKYW